ncbi:hypothetical protein [Sebaldella sp. S0638]|uniref:hypothetical protein n=1 Tax=Sebaldella sp. S0638 TaxID=2957809 RepID=UPI0020A03D09|nr:hypothetical protein [Sebaldella sp. S0638]MCP1225480.1 hypothetical protein [Sebaldella sp. S0638]
MNMIIVSNISVWVILIITIFKLNRDRRKSNSNIEKIKKLIDENHIKLGWFDFREEIEKKNILYLKSKKIEITEYIKNSDLPQETKDNLKIELDIFIKNSIRRIEGKTLKDDKEIKSKLYNIFIENKIDSLLLYDDNYLEMIEDVIIKSSNNFIIHGRQNEN